MPSTPGVEQGRFGVATQIWVRVQLLLHIDRSMTSRVWGLQARMKSSVSTSLQEQVCWLHLSLFLISSEFSKEAPLDFIAKPPVINGLYPTFQHHAHLLPPDLQTLERNYEICLAQSETRQEISSPPIEGKGKMSTETYQVHTHT